MRNNVLVGVSLLVYLGFFSVSGSLAGEAIPRFGNTNCTFEPDGVQNLTAQQRIERSLNMCCSRIVLLKENIQPLLSSGIVCNFVLKGNGEIFDLKIEKSSGVSEIDQKALQVILKAAPFHAISFPDELYKKRIRILFSGAVKASQGEAI